MPVQTETLPPVSRLQQFESNISAEVRDNLSTILVTYNLLPATPATRSHRLVLWEGTKVPYNEDKKPIDTRVLPPDVADGEESFSSLVIREKDYIVAYITHQNKCTACSTAVVRANGTDTFQSSVQVRARTSSSVTLEYKTPAGNDPASCGAGAWVGLWEGTEPRWDGQGRLAQVRIKSNSATGEVEIPFDFAASTQYAVALGTGPHDQDIAAFVTFVT